MTDRIERQSRRCESSDAALAAAEGNYPIDYLIALRGDCRRSSQYAHSKGELAAAMENAQVGTHPLDVIFIWLPMASGAELQAMMNVSNPEPTIWG